MQKKYYDCSTKSRSFQIGGPVFVKNQTSGPKWLPGQIQEVRGSVTYTVLLQDGRVMKRRVDHRTVNIDVQPDDAVDDFYPLPSNNTSSTISTELTDVPFVTPPLRCSSRIRNPSERYAPIMFLKTFVSNNYYLTGEECNELV